MAPHLRVFSEPSDFDREIIQAPTVRIKLGDLLPLISMAKRKNFAWVNDFMSDEVAITSDLYEILRTFST